MKANNNKAKATKAIIKLKGSNVLADLAARISAEHEAASSALKQGMQHAIAAGNLLIEAKAQLRAHGGWLPWLEANCTASVRTCQAYMRVARTFGKFGANTQRVAYLSFRDALSVIAKAGSEIARQSPGALDRVIERVESGAASTVRNAVDQEWREAYRARRYDNPTVPAAAIVLPPTPAGERAIEVQREAERRWRITFGPNAAGSKLLDNVAETQARPDFISVRANIDEQKQRLAALRAEADRLESEAKKLRRQASDLQTNVWSEEQALRDKLKTTLKAEHGAAFIFTETVVLDVTPSVDAVLATMEDQRQAADALVSATAFGLAVKHGARLDGDTSMTRFDAYLGTHMFDWWVECEDKPRCDDDDVCECWAWNYWNVEELSEAVMLELEGDLASPTPLYDATKQRREQQADAQIEIERREREQLKATAGSGRVAGSASYPDHIEQWLKAPPPAVL